MKKIINNRSSYSGPIYSITKGIKFTDVCFLNEGSVFAGGSEKNFSIYDMLMPLSSPPAISENIGASFVNFSNKNNSLILTNG